MNIFFTDYDPGEAARSLPDKHIVKMPVEAVQMLVSACLRHDYQPNVITSKGTIHKGGYHRHPSTVWCGDTAANFKWTLQWGLALCEEYTKRYGKRHFAHDQLLHIAHQPIGYFLPAGDLTQPALAMPDELKTDNPVESYRKCIRAKVDAKPTSFVWRKGTPQPAWI